MNKVRLNNNNLKEQTLIFQKNIKICNYNKKNNIYQAEYSP